MKKPPATKAHPARKAQDDPDADTLRTRLNHAATRDKVDAATSEEESGRYASPPCYLAEFTDADGELHSSK